MLDFLSKRAEALHLLVVVGSEDHLVVRLGWEGWGVWGWGRQGHVCCGCTEPYGGLSQGTGGYCRKWCYDLYLIGAGESRAGNAIRHGAGVCEGWGGRQLPATAEGVGEPGAECWPVWLGLAPPGPSSHLLPRRHIGPASALAAVIPSLS